MIRGGDIAKGTVLLHKGSPYLVVEREFVNPGKGAAFARVKMKNLKDGAVLTQTINMKTGKATSLWTLKAMTKFRFLQTS